MGMYVYDFNDKLDKLCIENCPFSKKSKEFKVDKFGRFKNFNPCSPYHQESCVILAKLLKEEKENK